MTCDPENRSSIVSCITSARDNASQAREQISSEMWERLNQLYHETTQSRLRVQAEHEPSAWSWRSAKAPIGSTA